MRESRTYGSVRGALSDERPYRDRLFGTPNEPQRQPTTCRKQGGGRGDSFPNSPRSYDVESATFPLRSGDLKRLFFSSVLESEGFRRRSCTGILESMH